MKLSQLRGFEQLKAIYLEPSPFDIERDLVTPTFKLKRPQLLKYYKVICFMCFYQYFIITNFLLHFMLKDFSKKNKKFIDSLTRIIVGFHN